MTSRARTIAFSMILSGIGVASRADAQAQNPIERPAPRLDHRHQTGLSILPGIGYRIIVPYENNKDCGDSSGNASKNVCTSAVPFFLDLQLSFGLITRMDLVLDLRFGLQKDGATDDRQFALAPGIRVWFDEDQNLKFFTTVQLLYDSTDYRGQVAKSDFGVRNSNGLMYDVIRNVGFYVQFGATMGFRRWFRVEFDIGPGVQVRFP